MTPDFLAERADDKTDFLWTRDGVVRISGDVKSKLLTWARPNVFWNLAGDLVWRSGGPGSILNFDVQELRDDFPP